MESAIVVRKRILGSLYGTLCFLWVLQVCGGMVCEVGNFGSYSMSEEVCCNGSIHPLNQHGNEMGCCDGKLFQKDTHLCCKNYEGVSRQYSIDGIVYTRECCEVDGTLAEQHKNEVCCSGRKRVKTNDTECCGQETYSLHDQWCCEIVQEGKYNITPRPSYENPRCCGLQMYNEETHWCHKPNFSLHVHKEEMPCGSGSYSPEEKICCYEGTMMDVPKFQPKDNYSVPPVYECRESILYDANHFDFEPSNPSLNIKAHLVPKGHLPCGNGSYNPNPIGYQEFCCNNTVLNASKTANVHCCGESSQLYDRDSQQCCGNTVTNMSVGCCNGEIYSKLKNECCGYELIDRHDKVCCKLRSSYYFSIKKSEPNHTDCCVLESYNKEEKNCFNGKLHNKRVLRSKSEIKHCTFCDVPTPSTRNKTCNKAKEYKVKVNSITLADNHKHGTTFSAKILKPRKFHGRTVNIWVPYDCRCLKGDKKFLIFTNRRLHKLTNRIARLTKKDVMMTNNKKNRKLRKSACEIQKTIGNYS